VRTLQVKDKRYPTMDNKPTFKIEPFLAIAGVMLIFCFCFHQTRDTLRTAQYFMSCLALLLIFVAARKYIRTTSVFWVIFAGVFVKFSYVLYTAVWNRQHDVIDFTADEGHAAYINYILNHKAIPDFDPRKLWAFFQPPLHHIISAVWIKVCLVLGITEEFARENVQGLTFFYMSAMIVLVYFVCRELNLQKKGTMIAMVIVSLHPIFTLFSGSINNDALALFLMTLAFYLAIVWYKRPTWYTIILLAFVIGFSMIAKLSAGLIAPAVAMLFLLKLLKEKDRWLHYLLQFGVFGVICVPIGLSWTIRNKILFDMPANYIPPVGGQFGDLPFVSRLFDFRMDSVYPAMTDLGNRFDEHNIFLAMMKTSLFGEYHYDRITPWATPVSIVLFVVAVLLALGALVATYMMIFHPKSDLQTEWKWYLGLVYGVVMAGYLSFALGYSNFSAQDFRYAAIVITVEAILLGMFADRLDMSRKRDRIISVTITGATALFGACSLILYILIGMV